jgi:hypothetical protein
VKPKSREAYIGGTQRPDVVGKEARAQVGPGHYDSPSRPAGPHYTIGEKRGHSPDNGVPGAGTYDGNETLTRPKSKAAHIGGTQRPDMVGREARAQVGPGHYDSPSRPSGPHYTIGEKRDYSPDNGVPGAGTYDGNESLTRPSQRYAHIGGTERPDMVGKEARAQVGPGQYHSPSKASGPHYTIGEKREYSPDNGVPGAGTYDGNETLTRPKSKAAHIGGTERPDMVGREARAQVGPGHYDSPSKLGGPHYTIGEKREYSPDNGVPGAGTYDGNESLTRPSQRYAHIGGTERPDMVGREARAQVGPG